MKNRFFSLIAACAALFTIMGCGGSEVTSGTVKVKVKATSVLDPASDYSANYAVDRDITTAWNEGAAGNGVGEVLTIEFSQPVRFDRISIANGFQRTPRIYMNNHRMKEFDLIVNGHRVGRFSFKDQMGYQDFKLPIPVVAKKLEIKIVSVYESEKYDDAAISEVKIYNGENEIKMSLSSSGSGASSAAGNSAVMKKFVNKNWNYLFETYYGNTDAASLQNAIERGMVAQSSNYAIVRFDDNGKFVIYHAFADKTAGTGYDRFEGKWSVQESGEDWVKLLCKGKYTAVSNASGNAVSESDKQMTLTVRVASQANLSYSSYFDTYLDKYMKEHSGEDMYFLEGYSLRLLLPFDSYTTWTP